MAIDEGSEEFTALWVLGDRVAESITMWSQVYLSFFDKRLLLEGSFGLRDIGLSVKSMRIAEGMNELERFRAWVEAKVYKQFPALAGVVSLIFIPAPVFGHSARVDRNMMAFGGHFDLTYTGDRKE